MHFANVIFNANSYQVLFRTVILHFARQTLVFFENHKLAGFRPDRGRIEGGDEAEYRPDTRGTAVGRIKEGYKHYANTLRRKNIMQTLFEEKILIKKTYTVRNPFTCLTRTWAASRPGADPA